MNKSIFFKESISDVVMLGNRRICKFDLPLGSLGATN